MLHNLFQLKEWRVTTRTLKRALFVHDEGKKNLFSSFRQGRYQAFPATYWLLVAIFFNNFLWIRHEEHHHNWCASLRNKVLSIKFKISCISLLLRSIHYLELYVYHLNTFKNNISSYVCISKQCWYYFASF